MHRRVARPLALGALLVSLGVSVAPTTALAGGGMGDLTNFPAAPLGPGDCAFVQNTKTGNYIVAHGTGGSPKISMEKDRHFVGARRVLYVDTDGTIVDFTSSVVINTQGNAPGGGSRPPVCIDQGKYTPPS